MPNIKYYSVFSIRCGYIFKKKILFSTAENSIYIMFVYFWWQFSSKMGNLFKPILEENYNQKCKKQVVFWQPKIPFYSASSNKYSTITILFSWQPKIIKNKN